jgi:hypothetical protein
MPEQEKVQEKQSLLVQEEKLVAVKDNGAKES